jgi:ubiquinone/menaquinone biosynthesis C-methylase UbiE
MLNDKVHCMRKANQFEYEYWDGDRKYGFGGYKYDGRWKSVAQTIIKEYALSNNSSVLDVGCGKAFLLYEIKMLLPDIRIVGFDISKYALLHAKEEIKEYLFEHKAQELYPFKENEFDLVLSLNTLHNLKIYELKTALQEIQRVAKESYIVVEGYRDEKELFNLECWALTCECFFRPQEWIWMFNEWQYEGDYEFIYFE